MQAIVVNCQDTAQGKQAEETPQRSESKFRLLAQTAEKLLRSTDPQSVVNELCNDAMQFLDCQIFVNYLANEGTNSLHLNAYAGIEENQAKGIESLDYGVAVCGCVAQSGERIIAEDISHVLDTRTDLVRSYGVQAYCCHPLKTHDRLIGTLSFGTKSRPQFSDAEVEVMRTIADLVAVAMERVRAENSLRELNSTLERRVEERTAETTALASQLRELASDLTMTEQRERQRLAKVLHDHIQQMLVAAKLQTTMLVNRQPTESMAAAARLVSELLDQSLAASRTLTAELSPPVLYDAGLGPALQWLARHFLEKHGLNIDVEFAPLAEPRTEDLRIFLFDAVREALFNVTKHSEVTKAHINGFRGAEGRIHLVISDEGKGFNPASLQGGGRSEGFGLFSIQQRIKHLGGQLEIHSAPGKGTRLTLVGPKPDLSPQFADAAIRHAFSEEPTARIPAAGKIRVLLADDHHIIRQGLAGLLRMDPDIEIVGEAANGAQAISLTRSLLPDVVVMDVSMPVLSGIEATAEIHRSLPEVRIIGLSMHEEGELSSAIRKAGACVYVTKGGAPEALIKAIHYAARGKNIADSKFQIKTKSGI